MIVSGRSRTTKAIAEPTTSRELPTMSTNPDDSAYFKAFTSDVVRDTRSPTGRYVYHHMGIRRIDPMYWRRTR